MFKVRKLPSSKKCLAANEVIQAGNVYLLSNTDVPLDIRGFFFLKKLSKAALARNEPLCGSYKIFPTLGEYNLLPK